MSGGGCAQGSFVHYGIASRRFDMNLIQYGPALHDKLRNGRSQSIVEVSCGNWMPAVCLTYLYS